MSASISTKRKSIGMDFLKKTAGYITGATGSYISDTMTVTTSTLSEAKNTISEISAYTNTSIMPKLRQLKTQTSFKGIVNWFTDKEESYSNAFESDITMGFDIDTDPVEIGESQITEIGKNANQISEAVVSSSHKMVEAQLAATANLINTSEKQTAVITAGFDRTNDTLNKILEVLTHNTSALIEATVASGSEKSHNDSMIENKFSLKDYKKMVSNNFQNTEYGMIAALLPSILGDPSMLKSMVDPQSIVKMMIDAGLKKAAPNLKNNMKALDDAVSDTIMTSLIRLGENKNKFGIKGDLAKIFGIDSSRKNVDTSRSTLELKTVPFDSIAHEALTNAIPGYLRKILVAVGGEDSIYDYRSRSFKSKGAIRNEFREAAVNRGTINSASSKVKNAIGMDDFSSMVYDLMMTELGSRTDNGSARRTVDKLSDKGEAEKYIRSLFSNMKLGKREKEMLSQVSGNVSSAAQGTGAIDILNQVAKTNINRNSRVKSYVDNANNYNVDLSEIRDSMRYDMDTILAENGIMPKNKKGKGSTSARVGNSPNTNLQGLNYTNMALYEIYRRLNEGINVFQVGSNNSRGEPFKKLGDDYLQKPQSYRAKPIADLRGGSPITRTTLSGPSTSSDEENLLRNQEMEDGSTENLSGGQRFMRWGKKRGGDLSRAIFSGSPEQVRDAFTVMIREAGQAAGDGIKHGAAKINDSSGNVLGYLKHKITGAGYKTKDDDGNEVEIAKNEKGGFLGYFDELIFGEGGAKGLAKRTSSMGSKWFKSVSSYFDYGDKDNESKGGPAKRKQIMGASVGAMMGAGILGGPIGLIMGGIAGNAISQTDGIGDKIHKILFGDKEHEGDKKKDRNKRRGLIGRAVDNIVDPIRFQIGKTMTTFATVMKKNILGPLSNIGAAIKERMANAAGGVVSKVFGGIFKGATGILKKLIMLPLNIAKAPINMLGFGARGAAEVGGTVVGGGLNSLAKGIAGRKGRSAINERIESQKKDAKVDKAQSGFYGEYELDDEGNVVLDSKGRPKKLSRKKAYKAWKEREEKRRDGMRSVDEYTSERPLSKEEKEAAEAAKKTEQNTSEIADVQKKLTDAVTGEIIPGSSFKSHDAGVHERLDKLIEISRGNIESSSISESDNKMLPAAVGSSIKADKEKQRQENMQFGQTLIGAAVNAADEGGIDSEDAGILERITRDSQMGLSQGSMLGRFKELIHRNKNKMDARLGDEEEKQESFISKMMGGIGKVLVDNWPLVLGGLALFSDKFREIGGELLQKFGGWLVDNVPTIIKGVWDLVTGVNQTIENVATGAESKIDPVTNENKSVISAETHADKVENGVLSSALESGLNPVRLGKDIGIVSLERAGLRIGATGVQAGAKAIGGASGVANFATRAFQGGSAFVQGIAQNGLNSTGLHKAADFAGRAFTMGGSKTLESVSAGAVQTATKAGGFKAMMSKTFNPKTWFSASSAANVIGGIASTAAAGVAWDATEIAKNKNIVGNYGLADSGGYVQTNTTVKTITTTTIGVGGGIAIGAAVVSAKAAIATSIAAAAAGVGTAGAANVWNPVGWCALIIAGVLIIAAALAGLVNCLTGIFTDNANKDYAIRSNSSKLNGVVKDKVSYENGADNAMYVYCAQESDRVLGFTKGMFTKDPELAFGKFLRTIADGLASSPGAEVLLYDFINNMAVQGVPFASFIAGDSEECKCNGSQANTGSTGTPPVTREGPLGGNYTQVLKSTVTKNKSKVFSDIAANIQRQDPKAVWTEENLKYVYEAGKKVVDELTNKGIIKSNGTIDTGKFKGSPGAKKNSSGWEALEELARKNDSYFLTQCLVYINSKIEATKDGKQWLEDRKDDVTKLMDGLKDLFMKESEAQIAEMKAQGMSDKEIEDALIASRDPKGNKATGAADQTEAAELSIPTITNSSIKSSDKADVEKELKYLTASYAYSHPSILQKWSLANEEQSSISPDNIRRVENWKNEFPDDKNKKKILRSEMANAALNFAESAGDIFNLIPKFDWSDGGKIYTGKKNAPAEKHGSGFVIRGEKKGPGKGILDKLWASGEVGREKTPEDVHKELFGEKAHGKGAEATSSNDQNWYVSTSGVIGRIAEKIADYGSTEGEKLTAGSGKKWKNVLLNLPASNPPNLGFGGDDSGTDAENVSTAPSSITRGGNPLAIGAKISSGFGYRDLGEGNEFHKGVDLVPTENGTPTVHATFPGTIEDVKSTVPDNHTGLNVSSDKMGNYVKIKTSDGKRVTFMHMAANSIPSTIKKGGKVSTGDKLGIMGSTGRSTGKHLHYQFNDINSGEVIDPTSSVLGKSSFSDGVVNGTTEGSEGFPDVAIDTSSSVIETGESESGLTSIISIIKNAGQKFLNLLFGGLISGDGDSTLGSSSSSSINYDQNGMVVGSSGNVGYIEGPVEYLSTAEVAAIQSKREKKEVIDLTTGKSFFVSWAASPTYHSDWTPMTPADVQTIWKFLHPNGGGNINDPNDWSWNARPGILKLNGHLIACGFHLRPHHNIMGGNPGPPFTNGGDRVNGKWKMGGHMCMYYGDSPGGTQKCNEAARTAYELGNKMYKTQQEGIAASALSDGPVSNLQLSGENALDTWKLLKEQGYSDVAIAGIMGNLNHESGLYPDRVQGDVPRSNKSVEYAKNVDTSKITKEQFINNGPGGGGFGLAQWTDPSRKRGLYDYTRGKGLSIANLPGQVAYLHKELTSYGLVNKLNSASSIKEASNIILHDFEKPKNQSASVENDRAATGEKIFSQYANKTLNSTGSKTLVKLNGVDNSSINISPGSEIIAGGDSDIIESSVGSSRYIQKEQGSSNSSINSLLKTKTHAMNLSSKYTLPVSSGSDYTSIGSNTDSPGMDRIQELLMQVVNELRYITANTGSSSDLLGALNEKDFVDKGLRESIGSLSKSPKKNYSRHVPTSSSNVRTVTAMARP